MKLTDLKIGTQLIVGFGAIIILIAILGYFAMKQSDEIAAQTTEMNEHPLKVRRAIGDLKADILFMHRGMKDLLLAENEQEISTILVEIEKHKVNAFKQYEVLFERYLGPRTDIEIAYNDFLKWNSILEETIQLLGQGITKEVIARTKSDGEGGHQVEILLAHIQIIDDFALNKGEQFFADSHALSESLKRKLGLLVAGILGLSVLITHFLIRNILRPLAELSKATELFQEGNYDARCFYTSPNEFGQLAGSFNNMAETVEKEINLSKKAALLSGVMLSEDDAKRFCHALLSSLLEQTEAQMGAIYLHNHDKTEFEHFESLGMDAEGCKPFSADRFEGEFGAALATKKLQHITGIPEDSLFIFSTVSGKFIPREIITIPIVSGNETVAVISLSTIKSFSPNTLRLLSTILNTLSARMDGILAYRKIIAFSQLLENQNSELEAQKRELSGQTEELTEQNIELEMQKKQLDDANRLKTSFLSNMSHELRTPLNSVIALSGVLSRRLAGKVPDEEYSFLDVIERNGKHLLDLINDILDLSRIEAGRENIETNQFSVSELISEVVDLIGPQARQKNIVLEFTETANPLVIQSDYKKCLHILQNIVGNAVKFTNDGGVKITAEARNEFIHIAVTDTGIGMDADFLPHIFDEFRQADDSNTRKSSGTGLGMSIAKKYADLLGGSINVESTRGIGSRFTFSVPLQLTSAGTSAAKPEVYEQRVTAIPGQYAGKTDTKDKTILLVEDSGSIIIQMKEMLSTEGYAILVARNGNEALEQIASKIPDAMILDLMMPEVDGFEVLKRVREDEKTNKLPVIILTAKYITKEELAFLKHNKIHQLIQKGDINKKQLLDVIARMFPETRENIPLQKKRSPVPVSGTPVVLIVEDNPDNMLTIKALLEGMCEIIEAGNGRNGIEMAQIHKPHLILMDIALPGMNGMEVLTELRGDNSTRNIPVIAVTASAMKVDKEKYIAHGFDGYISKPIDNNAFVDMIKQWINVE